MTTTSTNAIAIAKQLGFAKVKIAAEGNGSITVRGRAIYAKVRTQLDREIGFGGTLEVNSEGDQRQHTWIRDGLGSVNLVGRNSLRTQEDSLSIEFYATRKAPKASAPKAKKVSEAALEKRANLIPPVKKPGKAQSVVTLAKKELEECLALGMFKGKGAKIKTWLEDEANLNELAEAFAGGLDSNEVIDMVAGLV